ncbi:helix-turn-helix domain-containing protein [Saccharomonospora iraqiensis]|uniref:helix-turn-helix domain-containing protein n=1 Tax=Saccharomonospora iraqiensis TaxID=52698 RepID=UPI00047E4C5C|nr:helix-turn-helix transcriptional regulator [Saccharomonospora iraqiensis]
MQAESSWLSPCFVDHEINPGLLAEVLREYRAAKGLSQAALAQLLTMDQSYVSKIETGHRQVRDVDTLLHIARQLSLTPQELGLSAELVRPCPPREASVLSDEIDPVASSQAEWRRVRRQLNRQRGGLARWAAELYRREFRVGDAPFLARTAWMPPEPIRLDDVRLEWSSGAARVAVTGAEPEASAVLPLRAPGRRFDRYTSAIKYLDRPSLFENRASYRLLDAELTPGAARMTFGLGTYFDKLDVSEGLAHETAAARPCADHTRSPRPELPLRSLVGDPFDLGRRAVMPAIETLTLRRDRKTGAATFLLHWRDPAKVATAAGIYGLVPAGEFQPSSVAAWDTDNDFDLWHSMVREYSEELLGEPERDGSSGEPLDYDTWPLFRDLDRARADGRLGVYCLGLGLDALTLTATLLTAVVIDDDVFDAQFGDAVRVNAEGVLVASARASTVSEGVPFTGENVRRLVREEPMASPGACLLARAWRFRTELLPGA